ncbi:hypothetical protein BGW38_009200 [Lunasporangiospora selenospora]|uniref:Calcineurin-like phosphoesterase domain-containing protein n=1 Tax=Lunasporangiospora selenospora TaxID=979761 RepID=A0A9P6FIS8_9FUNG|nr:hypothetical protein BGW38_009200 [Lunasporangiospora selenospora]
MFRKTFLLGSLLCLLPALLNAAPTTAVSNRVVAVGDLHSDYPQTVAVLRMANLVDADGNWSGGRDTLVQTGDIVDRGPDTIKCYQ